MGWVAVWWAVTFCHTGDCYRENTLWQTEDICERMIAESYWMDGRRIPQPTCQPVESEARGGERG